MLSIAVHGLALLALVVVPLLLDAPLPEAQTEARAFFASPLELAPAPPPPPPPAAQARKAPAVPESSHPNAFVAPTAASVEKLPESTLDLGLGDGVPGGVDGGVPGGVVGGVVGGLPEAPPPPAAPPVRVGGAVKEPRKLRDVPPVYPEVAVLGHLQGVVVVECVIDPAGRVAAAKVLRGMPVFSDAALEAVKQWVYTPTLLNGVPAAVVMDVTVRFRLTAG
ncbi:MAG TPA: energy transducer TonB [Vicinamibacteria bacterium]|nr:energy transducer TonB [Vicinamibacteria bacterium]